ncbi:LOW QUALITY PROTEIN: ankyrin repeat and SOCS box protein 3-like [Physella acuta]|uniref:LOW QUALITY PROTEIN: ankyrin repeat and SOCS box protein 3-like n=1 Tax=Physella acuta TaxID=109671 RepID=UPI0027DAE84C|nr:LOW QUALITY PROTEIN: ankyrin repeat and SOCS box protein 3-like [Physella acuta]
MSSVLTAVQANNPRALTLLLNGHRSSCDVDKALIYATREGFADCVSCLLKAGGDPDTCDPSGNTPLYLAVQLGHDDVVAILCRSGSDVDARGSGQNTPLHVSARWGRDECLELLLAQGCNLNARDSNGSTALTLAVRNKQYYAISRLMEAGCDVNIADHQGRTALHYASHTAVAVEKLLRAGADVNVTDQDGCTPLLMAATEGLDHVIHSLCQTPGVDVNIATHSSRKTPLHILAYKGHIRCVNDLIAAGADINLPDKEQKTPLWYAVAKERYDITALLLRANGMVDTYQCPLHGGDDTCPVKIAVQLKLVKILKLFILSGYDNQHMREALRVPETQALFVNNQISHWLLHAQEVTSLRQICRKWLRHHLGYRLFMDISKLPLPQKILDYVCMKELEAVAV